MVMSSTTRASPLPSASSAGRTPANIRDVCGRFTLTYRERERLARKLGIPIEEIPEEEYRARYNTARTDSHWIVRLRGEEREARPAKWGLVNSWSRDAKRAAAQINARADSIAR